MIDDYTVPNSDEYHTWDFKPFDGLIFHDDEGITPLDEIEEILDI
jgi:hypothetical protein